ncbi:TadE/TadG family type IV pilus assembly protein [Duganella callida]|uniref:Pilus assembly protein TadE n=1 Tax=Duganella callida TaxID=2561932 RepID=A0A4Y9SGK8_9BURK|nr:pilus assembly protein TadG-related protein [Duganella callida]TFW23259.1 pilus assembly protein TadE [Duganella callida]
MSSQPLRRQDGAIAIMFALMAMGMVALIGLALDLALVYNRKAELQALADATALAAARQLDGTVAGITNALNVAAATAASYHYQYNALPVNWSSAALRFAAAADAADAGWVDAATAQTMPGGILYARVDTRALDAGLGTVHTFFMRGSGDGANTASTAARAVAGRMSTQVLPLAVCALSATPAAARVNVAGNAAYNELVEFGFRRGVAYDLMQLNPDGITPEHFLIDPLAPPGTTGTAAHFAVDVVRPFVCTGSMPMGRITGGALTVMRGFPLASLYNHLNSRFDQYGNNNCSPENAPPDTNIKPYPYTGIAWMAAAPAGQSAGAWTSGGTRLWTRADPQPGDATNTAPLYGPLWAHAKAVPYAAYAAAPTEPAAGYGAFSASAWASLYTPNPPTALSYPATQTQSTPYIQSSSATYFQAPSAAHQPGLARRRVLNVALLACPLPAGAVLSASVLGVGRFFMTVPATATSLNAEFGGAAALSSLAGAVELLP